MYNVPYKYKYYRSHGTYKFLIFSGLMQSRSTKKSGNNETVSLLRKYVTKLHGRVNNKVLVANTNEI